MEDLVCALTEVKVYVKGKKKQGVTVCEQDIHDMIALADTKHSGMYSQHGEKEGQKKRKRRERRTKRKRRRDEEEGKERKERRI